MDIIAKLKDELNVEKWQVEAAVKLIDEPLQDVEYGKKTENHGK